MTTPINLYEMLTGIVPKQFLDEALEKGVQHNKSGTKDVRNRFAELLRLLVTHDWISSLGFRNPADAPPARLLPKIRGALERFPPLTEATLRLWMETQLELRSAITGYAQSASRKLAEVVHVCWSEAELATTLSEVERHANNVDRNLLALGIVMMLEPRSCRDTTHSHSSPAVPELPSLFAEWIKQLSELAADAPEWNALETLFECAQGIRNAKRASQEQTRAAVVQLWETVRTRFADELAYFEVATEGFRIEAVPEASLAAANAALDSLEADLAEGAVERAKPAKTRVEDAEKNAQLDAIATRARGHAIEMHRLAAKPIEPVASPRAPDHPSKVLRTGTAVVELEKVRAKSDSKPPAASVPEHDTVHSKVVTVAPVPAAKAPPLEVSPKPIPATAGTDVSDPVREGRPEASTGAAESRHPNRQPGGVPTDYSKSNVDSAAEPLTAKVASPMQPVQATANPERATGDTRAIARQNATGAPDGGFTPAPLQEKTNEPTETVTSAPKPDRVRREFLRAAARDAARRYLDTNADADLAALVVAFVDEGDFAGGYWGARALEFQSHESFYPSWLLKAVAGSFALGGDASPLVPGLLAATSANPFPHEPHLQPLALAAALAGALRAPASGLTAWLRAQEDLTFLRPIVEPIREFVSACPIAIPKDMQRFLESAGERRTRIREQADAIGAWLADAPRKRTRYTRANLVWVDLLRSRELGRWLDAAAHNDTSAWPEMREGLQRYRSHGELERIINEVGSSIAPDDREIVGAAFKWLLERIDEATSQLASWVDVVAADAELARGDWLTKQLTALQEELRRTLPRIRSELQNGSRNWALDAAAATTLLRAVDAISELLGHVEAARTSTPWEWLDASAATLDALLGRRLVRLPSVRLPAGVESSDAHLADIARALALGCASDTSVEAVVRQWINSRDFRFVDDLLLGVAAPADRAALEDLRQTKLTESRRSLTEKLSALRTEVERAVIDGVRGDERAEIGGALEAIRPDEELDFRGGEEQIATAIAKLDEARRRNIEDERERWTEIRRRLPETSWTEEQQDAAQHRIEELLARGDYHSADELLARLFEAAEHQTAFEATLFESPQPHGPSHLDGFLGVLPALKEELKEIRGRDTGKKAQEIIAKVLGTAEPRREVRATHDDWQSLAQARGNRKVVEAKLPVVLADLGFDIVPGSITIPDERGSTIIEAVVDARTRGESPVPHFGSRIDGRLRVFCVWSVETSDSLAAALQHCRTEGEGAVVLFFGRLGLAQRRARVQQLRSQGAAAIIIDEWLLLYLAAVQDHRLRALYECGLPFCPVNPYVGRGLVAPEMFFGRADMARELKSFAGTCLVYGGRQLGKSALLEHVRRTFVADDRERHTAVLLDIQSVGDAQSSEPSPEQIWPKIRDALKHARFFSDKIQTDNPVELADYIRKGLTETQGRKLLILLDEADKFLDADSQKNFEQVKRLRSLMTSNPGACKVVLAGLHNVQRFQGIANQPLAHFGAALLVGPLEPAAADDLIRVPLEALGFRFAPEENNGAVLRILSYTNYHPGLIQIFCRSLVALLQARGHSQQQPPYVLREADVEEVYRRAETRRDIKDRFEWTLALDTRYQAVVWTLIVEQHGASGGYSEAFSPPDVLALVRNFWPQGFAGMESEQMRGLLDEMHGLGVLARNAKGEYRLRSPNVVRLLGHVNTLWDALQELEKKQPKPPFDADHHRLKLGTEQKVPKYSPLTYQQERLLLEPRNEVVFLVGTRATQLEQVKESLEKALGSKDPSRFGRFVALPDGIRNSKEFHQFIQEQLREAKNVDRLVMHRELIPSDIVQDGVIDDAQRALVERTRFRGKTTKVLFTMRPATAWAFALAYGNDTALQPMYLRRWTRPALDTLFDDIEIRLADEQFRERVLDTTTGGWPVLVREFAARFRSQGDERAVATSMEVELSNGKALARQFWNDLELEHLPRIREVLDLIGDSAVPPGTSFEGALEGDLGALSGRSATLLSLLHGIGVLESSAAGLRLEHRVRHSLLP